MEDEGLTIFPTHKLVFGLKDFDMKSFLNDLCDDFAIHTVSCNGRNDDRVRVTFWNELTSKGGKGIVIGLYGIGSENFHLLELKDSSVLDRKLGEEVPKALKRLDVTTLHKLILKKRLGIDERELREASHIMYIRDDDEAIDMVKRGDAQVAFLVNPVAIEDLREVALSFNRMPQKSTFFYPKLLSGLLINPIQSEEEGQ